MGSTLMQLISCLESDPWRSRVGFSSDMEAALRTMSGVSSDADRSAALSDWLQHYQPCLFGRIAAQRGLISYCILTTADIEKGDDFVRDKIQASRTEWSAAAFDGARSGFLIAVVSPELADAKPNETVAAFARTLVGLYLQIDQEHVELDKIYLDDVRLEAPLPGRPTWQWDVGVNYFSAQADRRWWNDHRIPAGLALSMNSVGHMVKSTIQSQAVSDLERRLNTEYGERADSKLDSLDKALRMAMMTIDRAAETSSGRATWLLPHPGSDSVPRCPIKLPLSLADKNHCEYAGYYHTDVTLPSAYFKPDVDRPKDQSVERLDLTYLNEAAADPIDRSRTAAGRRIRAPLRPDPIARQSKFRRAHPTTTRRGTLGD